MQAYTLAFVVTFVAGPALCALLLRMPASQPVLVALGLGVVALITAALVLQGRMPQAALAGLWLGWITMVAMMALALKRKIADRRGQRWITVTAILATTLPWFGLATARLMV